MSLKKFFNIESPYKFEWNDLRCFITVINVILIMTYGLSISWFGLLVAVVGIIKDLTKDRRINGLLMHLANAALNIYFLWILYRQSKLGGKIFRPLSRNFVRITFEKNLQLKLNMV